MIHEPAQPSARSIQLNEHRRAFSVRGLRDVLSHRGGRIVHYSAQFSSLWWTFDRAPTSNIRFRKVP